MGLIAVAPQRIPIVQPNWVGDAVMATPTLAALRSLYPGVRIACLMRRSVKDLCSGMPWGGQFITYRTGKTKTPARRTVLVRLGRDNLLVRWERPRQGPAALSRQRWSRIAKRPLDFQTEPSLIVHRRGYRTRQPAA